MCVSIYRKVYVSQFCLMFVRSAFPVNLTQFFLFQSSTKRASVKVRETTFDAQKDAEVLRKAMKGLGIKRTNVL